MADVKTFEMPNGTVVNCKDVNAVKQVKIGTTTYNPTSGVVSLPAYPTVPTVNNGTLTIQKNGSNVQTFTANQSSNATANITVPTKVSELTNDSGYTTNTGTVTQVKVGTTAYNPTSGIVSLPAYPTVPTVNNGTLTIQKNGSNVATFTANQSGNSTANITVPTVNNGTLTIQKNGSNVATFTANQSGNATANITVPTKTSDLTNNDAWVLIASSTGSQTNFSTLNGSVYHSLMLEFYIQVNGSTWLTLATPLTIQSITGSNNGTTRIIRNGYKGIDPEYLMIQASLNSTSITLSAVQCNYNVTSKVVYLYAKK